jgi:transposase
MVFKCPKNFLKYAIYLFYLYNGKYTKIISNSKNDGALLSHHDRDLNTARNIEREGLSLCGLKVGGYSKLAPRTPQF